jgi:hypothetical protein
LFVIERPLGDVMVEVYDIFKVTLIFWVGINQMDYLLCISMPADKKTYVGAAKCFTLVHL